MALHSVTKSIIASAVKDCDPFTRGNVSGDILPAGLGQLPNPFRALLCQQIEQGRVRYVVVSYQTPIAWLTDAGWMLPPVDYSKTTKIHQNVVRAALHTLDARFGF